MMGSLVRVRHAAPQPFEYTSLLNTPGYAPAVAYVLLPLLRSPVLIWAGGAFAQGKRGVLPKVLTIDAYDGPKSSAGKARPKRRCRALSAGRNDVRRAILGHRRPDFRRFWMSLQSACGTRTAAPIAPNQKPHKCRSYESIVRTFGITAPHHRRPAGRNYANGFRSPSIVGINSVTVG